MTDSPAASAGLQDGDEILSFDGFPTQGSGREMVKYVSQRPGEPVEFVWSHEGEERRAVITPETLRLDNDEKIRAEERKILELPTDAQVRGSIGIWFQSERERTDDGLGAYIVDGYQRTFLLTAGTLDFIKRLVTGQTSSAEPVVGPIGMAHIVSRFVDLGPMYLLHLFAVFNVCIGLLNLMPIPMLDGGRFIIMGIEGVRQRVFGRDLFNKEKEAMVHFTGLVLLLLVAVVVAVGDVGRIARKEDVLEGAEEVIRQEANEEWQKGLAGPEEDTPEQEAPEAEPSEGIAP
jgi:regulator of sigma E protease